MISPNDGGKNMQSLTSVDRIVHEPARLTIMSILYIVEGADFTFLMRQSGLTWGNLSSHMSKLEDAGYIEVVKEFRGKKPNTMLCLTEKGRAAFQKYRRSMKQMLENLPE